MIDGKTLRAESYGLSIVKSGDFRIFIRRKPTLGELVRLTLRFPEDAYRAGLARPLF
jgi:hypothetical protein